MLRKNLRSIGVFIVLVLLLGSFTVALAYKVDNTGCSFASFESWYYNSNSNADGVDTATGRATLTHIDGNGKYWGTVSVNVNISGVQNDGVTPFTVYGNTKTATNPASGYVRTTTNGLTPWSRGSSATFTAHCTHNQTCSNKNQHRAYLNENW